MNDYSNTMNSSGLLKDFYKGTGPGKIKGPVAQMNESMPMMEVLRRKRDMLKYK